MPLGFITAERSSLVVQSRAQRRVLLKYFNAIN